MVSTPVEMSFVVVGFHLVKKQEYIHENKPAAVRIQVKSDFVRYYKDLTCAQVDDKKIK